jgi:hypothetical protein
MGDGLLLLTAATLRYLASSLGQGKMSIDDGVLRKKCYTFLTLVATSIFCNTNRTVRPFSNFPLPPQTTADPAFPPDPYLPSLCPPLFFVILLIYMSLFFPAYNLSPVVRLFDINPRFTVG